MDFGAFVNILPGRDGLVHISQISEERVERVSDKLKEGDRVRVKVLEVDKQGRIRLSMKAVARESRHRLSGRGGPAATFRSYGPGACCHPAGTELHRQEIGESDPRASTVPTRARFPRQIPHVRPRR